jgi:hypothetical protein
VTAEGLKFGRGVFDAWGRESWERSEIPWEKVVPIAIDPTGRVYVLTRDLAVEILGGGGSRGGAEDAEEGKD